MVKSLFIFGNGLGRSISNDFFDLKRALEHAWNVEDGLTEHQKELIRACLPDEVIEDEDADAPQREDQLEELQRILSACDIISKTEDRLGNGAGEGWLSGHGREFPAAIRRYFHHAACYFLDRDSLKVEGLDSEVKADFSECLRDHIRSHGAHIATLNYDDLLYEAFCGTDIFNRHLLRDGFFKKGKFDFSMAEGFYDAEKEGWFLHLHGSPLFVDEDGEPRKVTRAQLADYHGHGSTHLVLTSVKFKRYIIQSSEILRQYWGKFRAIVPRSNNIILLGYGGEDVHLNDLLSKKAPANSIRIVEYRGEDADLERDKKWREALNRDDFKIVRLENIQEFREWYCPAVGKD
ncbi:SIR2-like protein [Rhodobacter aestuarii]|uniref:SIR2-like domain-containing protein n=1 Tax=Rhodobacter aestuarii TaxID=453582 RepID=A0A1N7K7E2_9RHOB|nr:SIR2 family protein [Rhodobacter aestuarii]PTV95831.1 SIR2-like protein [Rhodobacter aestuarii]SIS57354.1 SIR2-like domain-containing protein [Rhodobacter aestuarii]